MKHPLGVIAKLPLGLSQSFPLGLFPLRLFHCQPLVFWSNQFMSQVISTAATATLDVKPATTTAGHALTFVGKGGNIPDGNGSFHDDITVTENFTITDVTVTLNDIVHTWVGDLVVRLRHLETQTMVELFRRPGQPQFSSSGYSNDLKGDYSFNDSFNNDFEKAAGSNSVIPSGNYASLQSLSAFRGLPSAGTWQIIINDYSAGDSGCLGSWRLDLARG
jgi:subtilisin-like proprotein convertase family protein